MINRVNIIEQELKLFFTKNDKRLNDLIANLDQKIEDQRNNLTQKIETQINALERKISTLESEIKSLENETTINQKQLKEQMKKQEQITTSIINRINDQITKDKTKILSDLEAIKSQQDILKISFSVNEKQLLEKVQTMINDDIRLKIKGKEQELLMKLWIDQLKEIISNFENLKKMHPNELLLQMNEISNIIDIFKQKLSK